VVHGGLSVYGTSTLTLNVHNITAGTNSIECTLHFKALPKFLPFLFEGHELDLQDK
jgi:hypothetical protein